MMTLPKMSLPVGLSSLRANARWFSDFSEVAVEFVRQHGEQLQLESSDQQEPDLAFQLGPILSQDSSSTMARLILRVLNSSKEHRLGWGILIEPRPDAEPPTEIIATNAKIGYWNGFVKELSKFIPSHPVEHHIQLRIQGSAYVCQLLPRKITTHSPDEAILAFSTEAQLEQVGYRIPNAQFGIQEFSIVYAHDANDFLLTIHAQAILNFSDPPFLLYAESAIRNVLNLAFRPIDSGA